MTMGGFKFIISTGAAIAVLKTEPSINQIHRQGGVVWDMETG